MLSLIAVGEEVAAHRGRLKLTQSELARRAGISRATLDALENARAGELGFGKVMRLLTALGLDLAIEPAGARRPTLDDLMEENRKNDQSLDQRR